jgi:hypothetical protein
MVFGMSQTISPPLPSSTTTPTQTRLSFCEATPRDLKRWIAGLPKANIGETARLLVPRPRRTQPTAHPQRQSSAICWNCCGPRFISSASIWNGIFCIKSIMLDERSRKISNLCQALQSSTGHRLQTDRAAHCTEVQQGSRSRSLSHGPATCRPCPQRSTGARHAAVQPGAGTLCGLNCINCIAAHAELQLQHRRVRDDLASLTYRTEP